MKKEQELNITFHNPNTGDDFVNELVKVFAEVAESQIKDKLLHIEAGNDTVKKVSA